MRPLATSFLLFLFLSLSFSCAKSDPGSDPTATTNTIANTPANGTPAAKTEPAELERLSVQWMDAMVKKDKPALEALMAPEFVLRTAHEQNPETPRAEWLDNLMNNLEIENWEQKDIAAQIFDDVSVVTSNYAWKGIIFGHKFDVKGTCTDVWRLGNAWQVVSRTCIEF